MIVGPYIHCIFIFICMLSFIAQFNTSTKISTMSLRRVGLGIITVPLPSRVFAKDEKLWCIQEACAISEQKSGWCAIVTFAMEDGHTNALLFVDT